MEIKISKTAHACTACAAKFEHDQYVYSHVFVVEEVLSREDHCAQCKDDTARKQAYSAWTTQYYDPKVADAEPAEQFSPLRQLFYESVAAESRAEQAKAFLAAQLLRRQKVFRMIKQSDEADGEVKLLLYSDRIGNRLIEVRDPSFSFNELDKARIHMMERLRALEHAANAPEAEQEAAQEESAGPASEDAAAARDKLASEAAEGDEMTADPTADRPNEEDNDAEEEGYVEEHESDDEEDDDEATYDVEAEDIAADPATEKAEEDHVKTL